MTTVNILEHGSRNSTGTWTPFNWEDPLHGPQSKGEVVTIRTGGTSGTLAAGVWHTGVGITGCEADGTCDIKYSAPLGDETMVLLEGSAEVTVTSTGKKYHFKAGDILSHPKHVDLFWHVNGPFLKKFWVIWDAAPLVGTKSDDLFVGNLNDNPKDWETFSWEEPGKGLQKAGEVTYVRKTGSTGSLTVGLWRSGRGLAGADADGTTTFEYSAPLGDETILLVEGHVEIKEHESGKVHNFTGGDVIALPSGLKVTWTSKGPFVKKYFVITNGKVTG